MTQQPGGGPDFVDRLRVERIDRDIFTGWCHAGAPMRAFGGQVAAQALVAAGTTVEDSSREVHSLHAYFLRPGRTTDPIVYLVDRPRDSRSFTTRRVRAVQYGETIFTMSASFAVIEPGPTHQVAAPVLPSPDECEPSTLWITEVLPDNDLIDARVIDADIIRNATGGRAEGAIWMRSSQPLPDDHLTHVCAVTYFSDLRLAGTALVPHGGYQANPGIAITSLDHAMWFHADFRADRWLLFVQDTPVAGRGHGLNRGEIFTEDGRLVVSAVQESLMRVLG